MAPLAVVDGIEYALLTKADAEEMMRLLGDAFAGHDPPAVAVGLTPVEFIEFVELLCTNPTMEGLTVIARSVDGGEMAGVLLAEDSASGMPVGMEKLSSKFNPIFDILGKLEAAYGRGKHGVAGESAHLFLLGVAERFTGRGIGRQLVEQCIANAALRGYRRAVTEATNPTSQAIFQRARFQERVRESYRDYRYDGEAIFASIGEIGGPILMDRVLG